MRELVAGPGLFMQQLPLAPVYLGQERCEPLHRYGRVREDYLIHYVADGFGRVHTHDYEMSLHPGQAFILLPGQEHWYQADQKNPWTYWWVGFSGPHEDTLKSWFDRSELPVVVTIPPENRADLENTYRNMWEMLSRRKERFPSILLARELISFLTLLFAASDAGPPDTDTSIFRGEKIPGESRDTTPQPTSPGSSPIEQNRWQRVDAFMEAHYAEPISVQSLCRAVGVSRADLHRLCIRHTGSSAKRELTRRRMERAAELLRDADRPIVHIAALCGYLEYQTFERQFRRYYGLSPGSYRREKLLL